MITLPVLGFAVLPSFTNQHEPDVDLGPIDEFPEGEFVIATFLENPEIGEVSRRTMYIRNNGQLKGVPSFTVLYSRCVHLGCPTQPNGPIIRRQEDDVGGQRRADADQPAGFGCPCHGGQYDTEGNRTAGPPVRALDRAEFSIIDGNLHLGTFYSVAKVEGQGARARIYKYGKMPPGVHVDGRRGVALSARGAALDGSRAATKEVRAARNSSRRSRFIRSTGSRSARVSSAASSTSSSARCRATRAGSTRSAPRR